MKKFNLFILLFSCFLSKGESSQTQTVRGQVIDKDSRYPVIGATVMVLDSDPILAAATDVDGYFVIKNVPIGRVSLKVSSLGYQDYFASNLLVVSGKELQVNIQMEESITKLDEIVISSKKNGEVNNENASVSVRSFDAEQAAKYAGSLNDPSRMAANFAGVQNSNDSRNDIVVRGNSPLGLLWRLEDIDIPNPNHFGTSGSSGGPISMINNNLLASSDFLTAAFPASYGNATSAVFDLKMRNGNNEKHEFLGQIGFNGFEVGAEGPFSKESNASYILHYRLSTLEAFDAIGMSVGTGSAVPKYQDLSFKLNLPTENKGRFTLFALGGKSAINLLGSETDLDAQNSFSNETEDIYNNNSVGILGLSHTYFFNKNTSYKLTMAASHQYSEANVDSVAWNNTSVTDIVRYIDVRERQNKYSAHLKFNSKINSQNKWTSGLITDFYDIKFADSSLISPNTNTWFVINDEEGTGLLSRIYTNWQHKFNDKVSLNMGVHHLYFNVSKSNALEPRIGLKFKPNSKNTFSFGFGVHHQLQALPIYYKRRRSDGELSNKNLDFTRSRQLAAGWDHSFSEDLRLKTEVYYQQLSNIPIEDTASSFSLVNIGADFGTPDNSDLVNEGTGYNYGVELTLEKFYSKQYYFLLTTSLFNAKYKGSDGKTRNSAFNNKYVINLLAGKEWKVGKAKKNQLSFDWKFTYAGGRFYSPLDREASILEGNQVIDDENAFSQRFSNYFRTDIKLYYRLNRPKVTHEMGIEIQNFTNRDNIFAIRYNERTQELTEEYQLGILPIPQYRLLF